ncbi:putative serine/threonine-protein kinase-like [Capsicum annuum]|nr:putative serine/threonine-protein kinase-like [Capsicum annuum]
MSPPPPGASVLTILYAGYALPAEIECKQECCDVLSRGSTGDSLSTSPEDKDSHYMDKKASGKGISEEVTRESLIAISYSEPEKDLPFIESAPENSNNENVVKSVSGDTDDKYRSELISISYAEPPDTEVQPVSPKAN